MYYLIINESNKLTLGISKFPQVIFLNIMWASWMAPMQETPEMWVPSLGLEDPLEEEMPTHSSILPRECHGQRGLEGSSSWGHKGHKESDMTE